MNFKRTPEVAYNQSVKFNFNNRIETLNSRLYSLSQSANQYQKDIKYEEQPYSEKNQTSFKLKNSVTIEKDIINSLLSQVIKQNSKHLIQINKSIGLLVNTIKQKWTKNFNSQAIFNQFNEQEENDKCSKQNVLRSTKRQREVQQPLQNFLKLGSKHPNFFQLKSRDLNDYFGQFQNRFKIINIQHPFSKDIEQILAWVGQVCKRVFSVGFTLLLRGQLNQKKVKVFCSENILRNLIKLSYQKNLGFEEFQRIDKCLKDQLLPYFCFKYPQTQEKKISNKFQSLLIQRDTLNENQNDLFDKSGIDFHYEEDGNYNSQIMKFFNFIMSLSRRFPGLHENQKNQPGSLGQKFRKDMKTIFQSIENEQTLLKLYDYEPKNNQEIKIKGLKVLQKLGIDEKKDYCAEKRKQNKKYQYKQNQTQITYQKKVKQYTTYQIGQKLAQIDNFTQYEIKRGIFQFRSATLMRAVTKWCQQLQKNFDSNEILNRYTQWKMKNGSEKYLKKKQMIVLNTLLQREKQIIDSQMKKIKAKNYEYQVSFSQTKIYQQLRKYSEEEAMVGQFSSVISKINQNYLIKYLNLLIHGINRAVKDFQQILRVGHSEIDRNGISQIFQDLKQQSHQQHKFIVEEKLKYAKKQIKKWDDLRTQDLSLAPQLISFKIGDLLRCKCTSKQSEIITLYKLIEYISVTNPNFIKIVRVKNKLDQGNKDILMNIMYRNSILIQMQLAIKSDKSKFIQQSNKFNHYFYQMKRAKFGPIMEMCSIWMSNDQRSQFYLNIMKKNNQRKSTQKLQKCCADQCYLKSSQSLINIPFKCIGCSYFYFQCNFYQKHSLCQKKGYLCFKCRIQLFQKIESKKQLQKFISQNLQINTKQQIKICKKLPLDGGRIININSKDKKLKIFKTIQYKDQYYLFNKKNNNDLQLIQKFKKHRLTQEFIYFSFYNVIFKNSSDSQQICKLSFEQAEKKYFIPKYLQQIKKLQKKSIAFIGRKINEQFFIEGQNDNKIFSSVQKLDLSQNQLISIQILNKKFPNAQLVVINDNKIKKISQKDIENWKQKLQKVYLKKCQISDLNWVSYLKNLIQLDLQANIISEFPNIALKNLIQISLKKNKLRNLPDNFGLMSNLKTLDLSKNLFTQFPDPVGLLQNLVILKIYNNSIKEIKQTHLLNLKKLKYFNANQNQISSIPNSIQNLKSLQKFQILQNNIQQIPDSFGNLPKIQILQISLNSILELPESFCNLQSLKTLYICQNKLSKLPMSIKNLRNLRKLWFYQNNISYLPINFGNLQNLRQLIIYKNNLLEFPESFTSLQKLQTLQVEYNQLKQLPKNFGNLQNLRKIVMSYNKLESLPQSFGNLENLLHLQINNNKLKELPQSFGNLKKLQNLQIFENQLRFPLSFPNLKKVQCLNASENKIQQLHESIGDLQKLQKLFIQDNKITKLPYSIGNLKNLKQLVASKNNIQRIPETISNLHVLQNLWIHSNKIFQLPKEISKLENLKQLAINHNNIKQLPQQLGNLQNLIQLIANSNNIQRIPQSFGNLISLQVLVIYQNKLQEIPESLCKLKNLKRFLFGSNQISIIPQSYGNLTNLESLSISETKLQVLPNFFDKLQKLEKLYLMCNKIKQLPNSFKNFKKLQKLTISSEFLEKKQTISDDSYNGLFLIQLTDKTKLADQYAQKSQLLIKESKKFPQTLQSLEITFQNPLFVIDLIQNLPNLKSLILYSTWSEKSLMITLITSMCRRKKGQNFQMEVRIEKP